MRHFFPALLAVLFFSGCGSYKSVLETELEDYYFNQHIGGTQSAGINEVYYFHLSDDSVIIEQMQVEDTRVDLKSHNGLLYHCATPLADPQKVNPNEYRKVMLFGKARKGDAVVTWELDSVPLKERIFMPSTVQPHD